MSKIFNSGGKKTDSYNGKLDFDQSRGRILGRDENFVPRLLVLANGLQFNMRVSREGVNVLTATDEDLIFNSDNNLFKIVDSGYIDVNKPANATDAGDTVLHNLGYAPLVIAYCVPFYGTGFGTSIIQVPYYRVILSGTDIGKVDLYFYVNVNSTNVNFTVTTPNFGPSNLYTADFETRFYYYIIQETAGAT